MEKWSSIGSVKLNRRFTQLILKVGSFIVVVDLLILPMLPLMYICGFLLKFLAAFGSILMHESGHMLAAVLMRGKLKGISILPVGVNASIEESCTDVLKSIVIYLCGPFVNMLLIVIGLLINSYYLIPSDDMRFFIIINVYLAAFNLLPALPLDGGKIIRAGLASRYGLMPAQRCIRFLSLFLAVILVACGIMQMIHSFPNISLFLIGFYIISLLISERAEAALMNVRHIIFRRSRLLKKGVYAARDLVAMSTTPMGDILKSMDFDRFHIIHILDENMKLVKVFTEQEIINALVKNDPGITFGEYIRMQESP